MKNILTAVLFAISLTLVTGCAGFKIAQQGGKVLAEKQCEKSEERRLAERLAVYLATDEYATVKVLCPGDPELEETRKAAETAKCVFDSASVRQWESAAKCLAELMAESGVAYDSVLDTDGCFQADGWRICPKRQPASAL